MNKENKGRSLTLKELDAIMAPGTWVHAVISNEEDVIWCNTDRDEILILAKEHGAEFLGHQAAAVTGHGVAVSDGSGGRIYVQTTSESISNLKD